MNNGMIVGQALYNGQPVSDMFVCLDSIDGVSELNVGRGIHGLQRGIRLFTINEVPAYDSICVPTNSDGGFALMFKWEFLGSGGIPNDLFPFFNAHANRFSGGLVPQTEGVTSTRHRGMIMNSPSTISELLGINIPVTIEGGAGMAIDIASIWRRAGVNTFPFPAPGRSFIETQMFLGFWVFDSN